MAQVTDQASTVPQNDAAIDARQKRLKLREAGQKKFKEWKESRRPQPSAASSPAPCEAARAAAQHALANPATPNPASKLFSFPLVSPSFAGQQHQTSPGTPTHSSAAPANAHSHPCAPSDPAPAVQDAPAGFRDPLVDMLLLQVESLMRDKAALQKQNVALKRENEQLQELVGYLSEQPEQASPRWQQAPPSWEQHAHNEAQQPSFLEDQNNDACCQPDALGEEGVALVSVSQRHLASSKSGSGRSHGTLAAGAGDELDEDYCLVDGVHASP